MSNESEALISYPKILIIVLVTTILSVLLFPYLPFPAQQYGAKQITTDNLSITQDMMVAGANHNDKILNISKKDEDTKTLYKKMSKYNNSSIILTKNNTLSGNINHVVKDGRVYSVNEYTKNNTIVLSEKVQKSKIITIISVPIRKFSSWPQFFPPVLVDLMNSYQSTTSDQSVVEQSIVMSNITTHRCVHVDNAIVKYDNQYFLMNGPPPCLERAS